MISRINKGRLLAMLLPESWFIYRRKQAGRELYLTFDDGPHPTVTPAILELLRHHEIKATFFCIGENIERFPDIARRIHQEGHALGNHSYSHRGFSRLGFRRQFEEFSRTEALLAAITGERRHPFRAPQGRWAPGLMVKLMSLGVTCVHWSHDSLDCFHRGAQELIDQLRHTKLRGGDVVLFHDDNELAGLILAALIPYWKSEGYAFARL